MNVWLLLGLTCYEGDAVLGVFSSEQAAQNYKEKRATSLRYDEYDIMSWEVDSVLRELKE